MPSLQSSQNKCLVKLCLHAFEFNKSPSSLKISPAPPLHATGDVHTQDTPGPSPIGAADPVRLLAGHSCPLSAKLIHPSDAAAESGLASAHLPFLSQRTVRLPSLARNFLLFPQPAKRERPLGSGRYPHLTSPAHTCEIEIG